MRCMPKVEQMGKEKKQFKEIQAARDQVNEHIRRTSIHKSIANEVDYFEARRDAARADRMIEQVKRTALLKEIESVGYSPVKQAKAHLETVTEEKAAEEEKEITPRRSSRTRKPTKVLNMAEEPKSPRSSPRTSKRKHPSPKAKPKRRRSSGGNASRNETSVLFTGIELSDSHHKDIEKFGGAVCRNSVSVKNASHVVVLDGEVKRTAKLIAAMALYGSSAPHIVQENWVYDSAAAGKPPTC